jgi:predicted transposase YbfD/YdcC
MDLSGAIVSTDALSCQDDTAHTVLANGGDYVLQVKANQKGVLRQCEELSRVRPLVDSSKKKN